MQNNHTAIEKITKSGRNEIEDHNIQNDITSAIFSFSKEFIENSNI